jgi:hypothetical protein
MFPGVLAGKQTFVFRDFGLFSFPAAFFQRECFWRGELPMWNPYNYCGIPFLAQWNTMALYPPALIYLLLPLTWSLPFFCLVHMFWGGLGMYWLVREWTEQRLAGALAGIIFAFNGLSLNFLMWPSHVATFAWAPWVLWLGFAACREGGKKLFWAIAATAMQLLAGGPETILFTWVMLLGLALGQYLRQRELRRQVLLRFGALAGLSAILCAAQLLPFLELLATSQRHAGYSSASHDWSMPFWGWANFLLPLFRTGPGPHGVYLQNGQYWTSSYYAGIGTVLLALIAVYRLKDWRLRMFAGLALLALLLAWGDTNLLFRALRTCCPGLGFVRYPVKFVILALIAAPVVAGFGFKALQESKKGLGTFEWSCIAVMLLALGLIVVCDLSEPAQVWRTTWQSGLSRAAFLAGVAYLLTQLRNDVVRKAAGGSGATWSVLLLGVFWLDLATHAPTQNPTVTPSVYAPGWARAHAEWHPEPRVGESRAMMASAARRVLPANTLPGTSENFLRNRLAGRANANLLDNLPVVDGFFSLVPRHAFEINDLLYKQERRPAALLNFLGVVQSTAPGSLTEWVRNASAMPMITAGQEPVFADNPMVLDSLTYSNVDLTRTVFLPFEARGVINVKSHEPARIFDPAFTSRRMGFNTESGAPAVVVISQTWYPAWRAYIDDQEVRLWRANYAFQALQVPAGIHSVQLVYNDRTFRLGVTLSSLGCLVWLGLWFRQRWASEEIHQASGTGPATGNVA